MSDRTIKQCDHCPKTGAMTHELFRSEDWPAQTPDSRVDACSTVCMIELVKRLTAEGKTVIVRQA